VGFGEEGRALTGGRDVDRHPCGAVGRFSRFLDIIQTLAEPSLKLGVSNGRGINSLKER
jgi:hypothetical protein